jgi:hypothetical protein
MTSHHAFNDAPGVRVIQDRDSPRDVVQFRGAFNGCTVV